MTPFVSLIVLALVAAVLVALGWWLLVASEGVYLGRRVVILLYDLFASHYDEIKHYSKEYDHALLAQPIMSSITPLKSPLVLDAATGTGRLPLALLRHKQFQGKIIGADLSLPMLNHAVYKFDGDKRVSLIRTPAEHLPFADDTFDVVSCLEALEFMVNIEVVLHELIRVLRPGGLLFVTNRIHTRFMPGKTRSDDEMKALLKAFGLVQVEVEYWQVDYNRVWARKPGKSNA
ncbi:MAG TPA: methyltransferase domain-containing protein, partial [Phototrophicaceae bacterium]|nr:methyltransferase domain-containing protein [Phototrophicaceae bacterium]